MTADKDKNPKARISWPERTNAERMQGFVLNAHPLLLPEQTQMHLSAHAASLLSLATPEINIL